MGIENGTRLEYRKLLYRILKCKSKEYAEKRFGTEVGRIWAHNQAEAVAEFYAGSEIPSNVRAVEVTDE